MNNSTRIILALLVILLTVSCVGLNPPPAPTQEKLEKEFNQLIDSLIKSITGWFENLVNQFVQSIKDKFQETLGDSLQEVAEYLGLAVPQDVGQLSISITPVTNRAVIDAAFDKAYLDAGAGRVLGKPVDLVHYWDNSNKELLIQYFDGGSEGRSAIVMKQQTTTAYALPGDFLLTYTAFGGPLAGFPDSSPKDWNGTLFWISWGRGDRQIFHTSKGESFAMLRPDGIKNAFILPPTIWNFYESNNLINKIGYPLSSYPLDDDLWRNNPSIPSETRSILQNWANQPIRMVIFQHGSLWSKSEWNSIEIVEAQAAPIDTSHFFQGIQIELQALYGPLYDNQISNACYRETLRIGSNIFGSIVPEALITDIGNLLIQGTLEGVNLVTSTIGGKLVILGTKVLIKLAQGQEPYDTVIFWFAGRTMDSFFTKTIGDILSKPTTLVVKSFLEAEYKALSPDRLSAIGSLTEKPIEIGVPNPFTAHLVVQYDPLTHMVNGIITSTCEKYGYAFSYRANPSNGRIAERTLTWDGEMQIFNLENRELMP